MTADQNVLLGLINCIQHEDFSSGLLVPIVSNFQFDFGVINQLSFGFKRWVSHFLKASTGCALTASTVSMLVRSIVMKTCQKRIQI
jgi:hypothetical protein